MEIEGLSGILRLLEADTNMMLALMEFHAYRVLFLGGEVNYMASDLTGTQSNTLRASPLDSLLKVE